MEAQLAAYRTKAAKLGADLGPHKPTVTMLRYLPEFTRLYAKQSFIGTILTPGPCPDDLRGFLAT